MDSPTWRGFSRMFLQGSLVAFLLCFLFWAWMGKESILFSIAVFGPMGALCFVAGLLARRQARLSSDPFSREPDPAIPQIELQFLLSEKERREGVARPKITAWPLAGVATAALAALWITWGWRAFVTGLVLLLAAFTYWLRQIWGQMLWDLWRQNTTPSEYRVSVDANGIEIARGAPGRRLVQVSWASIREVRDSRAGVTVRGTVWMGGESFLLPNRAFADIGERERFYSVVRRCKGRI